jgi:DNA polymerase III epsilon subunit-like protein
MSNQREEVMGNIVFIDTETTSLRPDRRAWEIGLIVRRAGVAQVDHEYSWLIAAEDLDLGNADYNSLKIGKFYDRHPYAVGAATMGQTVVSEYEALNSVESLTRGTILVGAVPNFDADVLGARMRAHDILPSWHYHLVDVETLAAGALGLAPPWDFDAILARCGLAYVESDRHTALGDARMARSVYDYILGHARG